MKFNPTPVRGTFDVLPEDMALRNWVQDTIKKVYRERGYMQIETPSVENLDLLNHSEGGENLRLLFKILKRGEKLNFDDLSENALCDLGLRFDLTLPLSRFYANNRNALPTPFKAFQMGYVWRAERPQKGRFRQFTQCDIDIIGDKTIYAEIDLLLTLPRAIKNLGFKNFTIKINDRRLLRDMVLDAGFKGEDFDGVCITLDKMDKVGADGVKTELVAKGYGEEEIQKLLGQLNADISHFDNEHAKELQKAIDVVGKYYPIQFEPTLVRGMGYYTGPIFEIVSDDFRGSIAGGGRYDNLLSKFQRDAIPAVGFSIGFERIITILKEKGFKIPATQRKIAIVFTEEEMLAEVITRMEELTEEGNIATMVNVTRNKLEKKINQLEEQGYEVEVIK